MEIFKRINTKKNKTIILNLHNFEIAKKFSDKILALKNGEIFFYKKIDNCKRSNLGYLISIYFMGAPYSVSSLINTQFGLHTRIEGI